MSDITIPVSDKAQARLENAYKLTGAALKAAIKQVIKVDVEKKELDQRRQLAYTAGDDFDFDEI